MGICGLDDEWAAGAQHPHVDVLPAAGVELVERLHRGRAVRVERCQHTEASDPKGLGPNSTVRPPQTKEGLGDTWEWTYVHKKSVTLKSQGAGDTNGAVASKPLPLAWHPRESASSLARFAEASVSGSASGRLVRPWLQAGRRARARGARGR